MRRFLVLAVILLALLSNFALAEELYADVELDVLSTGEVYISGLTNHDLLKGTTQEFTSKKGKYWTLELDLNETFDEYVFSIFLPKGASLNYVNGKNINIITDDNRVIIKSFGSNSPVSVLVQYSIGPVSSSNSVLAFGVLGLIGFFAALIIWFWRFRSANKHYSYNSHMDHSPHTAHNAYNSEHKSSKTFSEEVLESLNERQLAIINILKSGSTTQKKIEKALNLPKSSISRNIESLRRKGLIRKEHRGLVNRISLI